MLRAVGMALFLVGAAVPAQAAGGHGGQNPARAAHQGAGTDRVGPVIQETTTPLQRTRSLAISQPPRGLSPADSIHELVASMAPRAVLAPERRDKNRPPTPPWVSGGKSGLRLLVTARLWFAVAYRHLEGEDLWRRNADAGSVDYDSHGFMVRAHWRF
jgi:hypothetical protein